MDKFNHACQRDGLITLILTQSGSQKQHGGTDTLSAAGKYIFANLADKRNIRLKIFSELFLDLFEIFTNQF